jgi:hypothetical protein
MGEREVTVGVGLGAELMVKVSEPDVPPPGAGLCTVTVAVPEEPRSEARICAVSNVLETNVVTRWLPSHNTCEVETKLVPLTVSVKADPPALALDGKSEVRVGTGFGGTLIVKASEFELPPPGAGFCTATLAVPAEDKSEAGICAVRDVPDR